MSDSIHRKSIRTEKETLRKTIIKGIDTLDPEIKRKASEAISNKLIKLVRDHSTVLCYYPLQSEPDILPTIQHWLKSNFRVCLPKVKGDHIESYEVSKTENLIRSSMGILEPGTSNNKISPTEIDFILVPGIGFTHDGKRLGRGGGFYDKFLNNPLSQTLKIGVAFNLQVLATMRTETHDMSVDLLITE
jgi:5-formyltetrahydrofolate cyclo-ligase